MDPTSNGLALTGQTPLKVTNNIPGSNGLSQNKEMDFNITVSMPANFTCIGGKAWPSFHGLTTTITRHLEIDSPLLTGSTGNICTVRCRNNAQAGPFGK